MNQCDRVPRKVMVVPIKLSINFSELILFEGSRFASATQLGKWL
jgi:hypothetical protein